MKRSDYIKRDKELIRKILFKIEADYISTALFNLTIDGYEFNDIAYQCILLYDAGLVDQYKAKYGDNTIYAFTVGGLTWEVHGFLDKIREDTIWNKTKETIKMKGLPMVLDVIKRVATSVVTSMTEGVIKGLMNL